MTDKVPKVQPYIGKHRAVPEQQSKDKAVWDKLKSFKVPSPERVARGIGDDQTGGRDD